MSTDATPSPARPLVAFDEAGNTGQALLDPAQPVFVLASVRVGEDEARALLAPLVPRGAREAKFAGRRGREFESAVLHLLDADVIDDAHVKFTVYHKRFMVTTKIVDMLVETLLHERGYDLYANAENLALANLLHACVPAFCGAEAFDDLQRRFVAMVREKGPATVAAFYEQVCALRAANREPSFDFALGTLEHTQQVVDRAVREGEVVALDPAIPAFVDLAGQWTAEVGGPFDLAHDPSKPMRHQQGQLELLMTEAEPPRDFARNGPPTMLPLRATGIRFVASHDLPQIQLADVIAGAVARTMRTLALGLPDTFAEAMLGTRLGQLSYVPVWPSMAVTPDELGAAHRSGSAGVDYVTGLAARERERRAGR